MFISEGFEKFRNNVMKQTNHDIIGQTIYLIQTEDVDGNITDEKYGINLLTDIGMYDDGGFNVTIYLGSGTTPATYHDMYMEYGNSKFTVSMDHYYDSGMLWNVVFDQNTGMITATARTHYVTYEYNISGVTTDLVFTEIGTSVYGNGDQPGVATHSLIYDALGNVSSITKHPNEKLTIIIYRGFSIHEDVIINAYNSGNYIILNMANCPLYQYYGTPRISHPNLYIVPSRYISGDNSEYVSLGGDYDYSGDIDPGLNTSGYTRSIIKGSNSRVVTNTSYYYDKLVCLISNFISVKKIFMNDPENIVCSQSYTDSNDDPSYMNMFGSISYDKDTREGTIPVTDFNLMDSKMFNYKSGSWDIQDTFDTGRLSFAHWYGGYFGYLNIGITAIDPVLQSSNTYYVSINMDDSVPINSIKISSWNSDANMYYLAEKYWDTSTWVRIYWTEPGDGWRHFKNIPEAAKYYRYFISRNYSNYKIQFNREYSHYPRLTGVFSPYKLENVPSHEIKTYAFIPIVSETYKWMLLEDSVIAMNNDGTIAYSHKVYGGPSNLDNLSNAHYVDSIYVRAGFDNKLVVGSTRPYNEGSPRNIRIYDMTTMTPSDPPSFVDIHTQSSTYTYGCYFTKTTAGYVSIWIPSDTGTRANVINVNTAELVVIPSARLFHIQDFTTIAIYAVNGSNPIQFNVYDLTTNEVITTFTIDGQTSGNLIAVCGCGDYFYMQFGSGADHLIYLYTISTDHVALLSDKKLYMQWYNGTNYELYNYPLEGFNKRCYHRDGIVLASTDGNTRVIKFSGDYADPSTPKLLFNSSANYKRIGFTSHIAENIIDNDHSQLLLLDTVNCYSQYDTSSGTQLYRHPVVDLGLGLKTSTSLLNPYGHWKQHWSTFTPNESSHEQGGLALYNGKLYVFGGPTNSWVYPIEYSAPHKISGQTYTYQQWNNPKSYNFAGNFSMYRTNHGNITSIPSPPETFNVSGTPDGSGQSVRFKSWFRYENNYSVLYVRHHPPSGLYLGLSNFFRVNPGDSVTVNVTFKSDIYNLARVDHLVAQMFVTEDRSSIDPYNGKYPDRSIKHTLTGNIGTPIKIPTGTYGTQYLRIYMNIYALRTDGNYLPIAATFIDTCSISVTR